jgi:hypothetical protein
MAELSIKEVADIVVALVLVVSPLAIEAVSLSMLVFHLYFCSRSRVLPRDVKYSEVGEIVVIRDERTGRARS